jgi:hypothetical protein
VLHELGASLRDLLFETNKVLKLHHTVYRYDKEKKNIDPKCRPIMLKRGGKKEKKKKKEEIQA